MSIGKTIKEKRHEKGMTLEDVAKKMNISRQTLSRYENNIITNIPADRIEQLAKVLNCTPAYLMGWENKPNTTALTRVKTSNVKFKDKQPEEPFQQKEHEQNLIKKYRCLSPQGKTTVDNLIDNLISVEKSSPDKENNLENLPKHNELIGHGMVAFGGNKNKLKE